jgi:hypothetical protein
MTECCNHNCNEGRDCPQRRALPIAGREPFDWQLLVIWIAVAVAFGAVAAMSFGPQIAELIDYLWPRLVVAASF